MSGSVTLTSKRGCTEKPAAWAKALTLSGKDDEALLLERTFAVSDFETAVRALAQKETRTIE